MEKFGSFGGSISSSGRKSDAYAEGPIGIHQFEAPLATVLHPVIDHRSNIHGISEVNIAVRLRNMAIEHLCLRSIIWI